MFDTFPFLKGTEEQKQKIREIAEKLDAHRKEIQKKYPKLTLTALYNVMRQVFNGQTLNNKEKVLFEQGNIVKLKKLHDELDAAVAAIYGLPPDAQEHEILSRILELNFATAE